MTILRVHITLFEVPPTQTFWMTIIFTMSPKRLQKHDETEEQHVEHLRQELDDKFLECPETVIRCTNLNLSDDFYQVRDRISLLISRRGRQWLGLPLLVVSLPHQRVIFNVDVF